MNRITSSLLTVLTLSLAPILAQAGRVEVPPGREFQQHKVLTLGLTDTWEIDAEAGEFLHCVVESGEFDPVLELVDSEGERLGLNDGKGTRSELRTFAPQAGKFVFRVQGYEGRGGGSYRFWLLRYRTERLPIGSAAEHVFGPERWWHYRVAGKQGEVLVPRSLFGHQLTAVLDTEQRPLPECHGGYTVQRDGDVLLRVEGQEKHTCRVDVQLARQGTLPADGVLDAELPAGGMDVVRHHLAPGAWTFELNEAELDLDVHFRETKPGRHPRFGWMGQLNKNGRRHQWLLVREAMDAELVLRSPGGAASYCGRLVQLTAELPLDGAVEGVLPLGGGRLYQVDATPGQLVRLGLESSSFDGHMDIWTPDGGVYRYDDRSRLDLNPQHTFLVTQPGLHHVLVYTSAGAGSGPFTLRADDLPIPSLAIGEPLSIAHHGSAPYAHLDLTAGQELWLSVRSCAFDAALSVHDPEGRHVGTFEGGGLDGDVLKGLRAEKTGTYTLQIHSRRGHGEATLRAIRP